MTLDLVREHTILSVVVGSRAYGLATGGSDVDRRGVFAAPTALYWRFDKPPTHLDGPLPEQFSWELERFLQLALAANPTVVECLWSPLVERVTPDGEELLSIRTAFLSRHAHRTFLRYADGQFRKLEGDVRNQGAPRWKHAMHLLRLLISGRHLVEHGVPKLDVGDERDRLLAVRRGEVGWDEVDAWRGVLTTGMNEALARSPLPAEPDRTRVEDLLYCVRRRSADR
ncbi:MULTISPECIES: nucleotidyltransferase domain-containing protein [Thermomonosporaceae]|uniref:nucleotidyltransferase domain-containing protein n=1 Tax=Thermomonosporaceae TaxID=2012 RepID=UPI00255A8413|nr:MULTISPECIES: nucleotidyltransferase domain-containing protein [Thermomonosporaceae]MDL4774900.1 nucleotidyltransferase domain-containing protein [Actinomadura xylanilytica]